MSDYLVPCMQSDRGHVREVASAQALLTGFAEVVAGRMFSDNRSAIDINLRASMHGSLRLGGLLPAPQGSQLS